MLAIEVQNQVSKELDNSVKEIKMDIAQLSRGDRISFVARTELNMVPAEPETLMIYMDENALVNSHWLKPIWNSDHGLPFFHAC